MKQRSNILLTSDVLRALRGVLPSERLLHRLHSVVLVLHGLSSSEVGRMYGDSSRAVAYWVTRFKERGLRGLEEDDRPGRPTRLDASQLKKVQRFMTLSRQKINPFPARLVQEYILNQFGVTFTIRQCQRMVKRLAV